ncbi:MULTISPECIES: DUF938 domain-containing protein [unclassified Brevundimonas]|uniref:DUF938 domain-containing protein n=1 Tax=unclassified Brevundimonas TaxID=2622653 RepID=UPI0025C30E92|nr:MULTISPECIES: DUF938 domain-containing protein [unclassified Brevundimonas]
MDSLGLAPTGALNSPAAERNAPAILARLKPHLPASGRVLEIASGSGQHAVAFAGALPEVEWHPSDPSPEARHSTDLWAAQSGLNNLRPALHLDMLDEASWPDGTYDAIVCINMVHISPWAATEGLMALAQSRLAQGGLLYLYGPYREPDVALAPSNAAFDESLKSRNPEWGLRDRDQVIELAKRHGLRFTLRAEMPANNISLMFRRF